jgi:thymidylate synthase (FAD)
VAEIEWRNEPTVELIDYMPKRVSPEARVVQAARVSSGTDRQPGTMRDPGPASDVAKNRGLLRMLQRDRHGSPFEHVVFTWRIETPLFVAREFMRHRIASYNETSGRYRELEPVFYVPHPNRPMVQKGKPGAYTFEVGTPEQQFEVINAHKAAAQCAWNNYQMLLGLEVAREVARNVLPLSLYTSFYVTMNFRAWENFTSLRWAHPAAQVPTFPLFEIEQVASRMEADVEGLAPSLVDFFNEYGRRPV